MLLKRIKNLWKLSGISEIENIQEVKPHKKAVIIKKENDIEKFLHD